MGTAYFVDFENVKEKGLLGIEDLTAKDKVILFYSDCRVNLPVGHLVACVKAGMKAEHFEIKKIAENYLDFQLVTYLGFYAARHPKKRLVIVSKDRDFIPVVDFWSARGRTIRKQETILGISLAAARTDDLPAKPPREKSALTERHKEEIRGCLAEDNLAAQDYNVIYAALLRDSQNHKFREALKEKIYGGKGREAGIKLSEIHRAFWEEMPHISLPEEQPVGTEGKVQVLLRRIQGTPKSVFSKSTRKRIRAMLTGFSPQKRPQELSQIYLAMQYCSSLWEYQQVLASLLPVKDASLVYQETERFFREHHGL